MKPGYSLIEITVGLVLASVLGTLLFKTFSQVQVASKIIDSLMANDMASIVVVRTVTRDVSGAFVPQAALKPPAPQPEKKSEKEPEKKEKQQTQVPSIEMGSVFTLKHKDKNLETLSFITCNPMLEYDQVKPRIARIVYRLVENEDRKGTFKLMRQESPVLNLKEFEKSTVKAHTVSDAIKSCTCSCTLLEYPEKKNPKEDVVPTARTVSDWVFDPQKAQEQKMVPIPYAVTFTCVFVDEQGTREWPVTFSVPIGTFVPFGAKQQSEPPKAAEPAKKPEAAKTDKAKGAAAKPADGKSGKPVVQRVKFQFPKSITSVAKRK